MGRPGPKLAELVLSEHERDVLGRWERASSMPQALALRVRIVLACAEVDGNGLHRSASSVARQVGVTTETVSKWRARFLTHRLDGLGDTPRPGRARTVTDEQVAEVVRATLETRPKDATHCSTRSMAARAGLSQTTVSKIWRAFGLKPHRAETFKLSTDPFFVDKVHDVVGLYLDPP
ncbi:helix-turn-helix domain-containing protein [Streptomyces sp. NPDC090442]|uniref:helix-turn-helix domain-containing protein n=1 Tax=Streptomyces sp. NPDC090442 TaxID=3365962 RepID=UPI00381BA741